MKRITILNGPPGIGKDTLATIIAAELGIEHREFKTQLYIHAAQFIQEEVESLRNEDVVDLTQMIIERNSDRSLKEEPWLLGMTVRELLIRVSEDVYKPTHGEDYFGVVFGNSVLDDDVHCVASDGGFTDEVCGLLDIFGAEDICIIQLHEEGFNFDNDSRDYVDGTEFGIDTWELPLTRGDAIGAAQSCIKIIRGDFE